MDLPVLQAAGPSRADSLSELFRHGGSASAASTTVPATPATAANAVTSTGPDAYANSSAGTATAATG